jgi:KDO2-lipid IV(A) lauroyltransferase
MFMTWLLANIVKLLCWLVACLPRRVQIFVGKTLGLVWFYIVPIRRKVALENLSVAFPEKNISEIWKLARVNFQNYGCGFVELLLLPHFDKKMFDKLVVRHDWENYENAKSKGKGVFFLTLHMGSWELMSATQAHLGIPLHVITKKFKARTFNSIWVELRLGQGIQLISEEKSTFQILRAIRKGEVVGFILDQFMGPPVGSRVRFFGKETGAPAALALFADRTRAPVVPVYNIHGDDGRIHIYCEPEVPFVEQGSMKQNISFMTQAYTSKIEDIVRRHPEQWLWIHRRWKPFRE